MLHGPNLQLCTLTIYENMVIVKHISYFKKNKKQKQKFAAHCFEFAQNKQLRRLVVSPDRYVNTNLLTALVAFHT